MLCRYILGTSVAVGEQVGVLVVESKNENKMSSSVQKLTFEINYRCLRLEVDIYDYYVELNIEILV